MSPISEIDAIKNLDETLSQLDDPATRDRVLQWAWDKFVSKSKHQTPQVDSEQGGHTRKNKKVRTTKTTKRAKSSSKNKSTAYIIKDLNLTPNGKQSFKSFVEEKQPKSNQEKCTVTVYYLRNELELENVSTNHIFTCYKSIGNWRVTDIYNIVALTASRKGWLDTSDMNNIKLTPHGENLVKFDLPKNSKTK
jgi:hypothetical protein